MKIAVGILVATATAVGFQSQQSSAKRIYIEERVKTTTGALVHCDGNGNCFGQNTSSRRNSSLDVTKDLVKNCPAVIVTNNYDAADYDLRISPGSSTLYQKNGDVVYVSPAHYASTVAKDVCKYITDKSR